MVPVPCYQASSRSHQAPVPRNYQDGGHRPVSGLTAAVEVPGAETIESQVLTGGAGRCWRPGQAMNDTNAIETGGAGESRHCGARRWSGRRTELGGQSQTADRKFKCPVGSIDVRSRSARRRRI